MPNIFGKQILFNDGEGVYETDLMTLQQYLHALIGDGLVSHMTRRTILETEDAGMDDDTLSAFGNSGAPFAHTSTNRRSRNARGLIAQRLSSSAPDGTTPGVLLYYVNEDEYATTHTAATTNPRWDVISVGLALVDGDPTSRDFEDAATRALTTTTPNKRRAVTATFTVTQGTEAASPTEPATPAGHAKIAAFLVTPGMTTFEPKTDIRDYRVPVGPVTRHNVQGQHFTHDGLVWGEGNQYGRLTYLSAGATDYAVGHCPVGGCTKRLLHVGLAVHQNSADEMNAELIRVGMSGSATASSVAVLEDYTSTLFPGGGEQYNEAYFLTHPIWANGYAAGYAVDRAAGSAGSEDPEGHGHLAIRVSPDNDTVVSIGGCTFTLIG